ncbi:MAG: YgiQ family radical SAM protein [Planctomycetes bacterium]|nr:YgiQ family radical SAM protein [Planctomycetota bacterium]
MPAQPQFLPMSLAEVRAIGWDGLDVILVSGDAYVDHSSFGTALIGRWLVKHGYRVGIIAQPDWRTPSDFLKLGRPRVCFGVTGGNLDSMVTHYTANKKLRRNDDFSPGGRHGFRPNRCTIVYANRLRELFKGVPILLGGIEASQRRLAHYDYWDDRVRRSILLDARADILVYGMGERQALEVVNLLADGRDVNALDHVHGTCVRRKDLDPWPNAVVVPSCEEVAADPAKYAQAFKGIYYNQNPWSAKPVAQQHGDQWIVQLPPALPLGEPEMDAVYDLPFSRMYHPSYEKDGGIPGFETVKHSITSHRGCYGACSFCTIFFHQGSTIQSRSQDSIVREAQRITAMPGFRGTIDDVGGPTANMYKTGCDKPEIHQICKTQHCVFPRHCKNLEVDHEPYLDVLEAVRKTPGVKKVRVATGIRYDLVLRDKSERFMKDLCQFYVGGQIKVAPEHASADTLAAMKKPPIEVYEEFRVKYSETNVDLHKKQYQVEYFIAGHPGSRLEDAIKLAEYIHAKGYYPEQVQDFTPTPMTLSTCMWYTGVDPLLGKPVYVPKSPKERRMHRALLQYKNPENYGLVKEALELAGRRDLIGDGDKCLIAPTAPRSDAWKTGRKKARVLDTESFDS